MRYRELGKSKVAVSEVSLGGHEYLPDKRSRGFNEDFSRAVTPGQILDGFGSDQRKALLSAAYDRGINFFDVTMDSEKEALGRNFKELPPPYPVYVQTRPEGMVYTYDPNNVRMGVYDQLKAEAVRIVRLLHRESIDFFNIAFMKSALESDPEYLGKIAYNINQLKKEGLIRFACCDTFSGEETYIKQIDAGCFDAVYINFSFADHAPSRLVLPRAKEKNMGVISREAFMKGRLFHIAKNAGITDISLLFSAALKWCLARPEVTSVVYGTGKVEHLIRALDDLEDPNIQPREQELLELAMETEDFKEYEREKLSAFLGQ